MPSIAGFTAEEFEKCGSSAKPARSRLGPLNLQVFSRHHDDDALDRAVFHQLRSNAQRKGGLTRARRCHGHEVLGLFGQELIEGGLLPGT